MAPRGGRGGGREPLPRSVQVSKKISWLLRHGAEAEGLQLGPDGFVSVQDVLNNRKIKSIKVSFDEIREIVRDNDKQRFTLVPVESSSSLAKTNQDQTETHPNTADSNSTALAASNDPKDYLIRANQGHSLKLDSEALLQPITAANLPGTAVHGTTHSAWPQIVASGGLKPMGRNHVHFASGLPAGFKSIVEMKGNDESSKEGEAAAAAAVAPVISGMRNSSTVLVFLDLAKAIESGIKFWLSDNGVILTEGDARGIVPLDVLKRVEDRTGEGVLLEDGKIVKEAPAKWSKR